MATGVSYVREVGRARHSRHLCRGSQLEPPGGARLSALEPPCNYTLQTPATQISPQRLLTHRVPRAHPHLVAVTRTDPSRAQVQIPALAANVLSERDAQRVALVLPPTEHRMQHRRRHVLEDELRVRDRQVPLIRDVGNRLLMEPYTARRRRQSELT